MIQFGIEEVPAAGIEQVSLTKSLAKAVGAESHRGRGSSGGAYRPFRLYVLRSWNFVLECNLGELDASSLPSVIMVPPRYSVLSPVNEVLRVDLEIVSWS